LVLRTKKDAQGRYTAGGVRTRGKYERAFGYFEAKVKFPKQQGHWCAFWIMAAMWCRVPMKDGRGRRLTSWRRPG